MIHLDRGYFILIELITYVLRIYMSQMHRKSENPFILIWNNNNYYFYYLEATLRSGAHSRDVLVAIPD